MKGLHLMNRNLEADMIAIWVTDQAEAIANAKPLYTIEATGAGGWMSYRYQYKVGVHDYFGYAETEAEALAIIEKAGA